MPQCLKGDSELPHKTAVLLRRMPVHYTETKRRRTGRNLRVFVSEKELIIFIEKFVYSLLSLNKIALYSSIIVYLSGEGGGCWAITS